MSKIFMIKTGILVVKKKGSLLNSLAMSKSISNHVQNENDPFQFL